MSRRSTRRHYRFVSVYQESLSETEMVASSDAGGSKERLRGWGWVIWDAPGFWHPNCLHSDPCRRRWVKTRRRMALSRDRNSDGNVKPLAHFSVYIDTARERAKRKK